MQEGKPFGKISNLGEHDVRPTNDNVQHPQSCGHLSITKQSHTSKMTLGGRAEVADTKNENQPHDERTKSVDHLNENAGAIQGREE